MTMTVFHQHKVKISEVQKRKLKKAVGKKKNNISSATAVILRLKKNELDGDDVLLFTKSQMERLNKAKRAKRGITIKMSKHQVKANIRVEGGFLGMLASLAARFLPSLLSKVAPALLGGLATGLISSGVEKAIGGHGIFLHKKNHCYKVEPVEGDGLYLSPHPHLEGIDAAAGEGIFLRTNNGTVYDGKGLLLGEASPFKNIPVLGWLL